VLRALDEAGVKIDIVGGNGVSGRALGGGRWGAAPGTRRDSGGRHRCKAVPVAAHDPSGGGAMTAAMAIVGPGCGHGAGLVVYPIDGAKMIGVGQTLFQAAQNDRAAIPAYLRFTQAAFAPTALPTWRALPCLCRRGRRARVGLDRRNCRVRGHSGGEPFAPRCPRRRPPPTPGARCGPRAARRRQAATADRTGRRYMELVGENPVT
jgi:hypothetical protein